MVKNTDISKAVDKCGVLEENLDVRLENVDIRLERKDIKEAPEQTGKDKSEGVGEFLSEAAGDILKGVLGDSLGTLAEHYIKKALRNGKEEESV